MTTGTKLSDEFRLKVLCGLVALGISFSILAVSNARLGAKRVGIMNGNGAFEVIRLSAKSDSSDHGHSYCFSSIPT